jgi:glyoxylate reductase
LAYNVLITKHIPEEGLVELRKYSHIYMPETEGKSFPREELFRLAPQLDAIIPSGDVISADFIEIAKKLKIISNYGVGYDNLDIKAANKKGIIVTIDMLDTETIKIGIHFYLIAMNFLENS